MNTIEKISEFLNLEISDIQKFECQVYFKSFIRGIPVFVSIYEYDMPKQLRNLFSKYIKENNIPTFSQYKEEDFYDVL